MESDNQVKAPLQVLHIEKRKVIPGGLNRHITREQWVDNGGVITKAVWAPANADPSRTGGNVELVSREHTEPGGRHWTLSLQQAVNRRIYKAGIKPKSNQNTCLEVIFSGSSERMNAMGREELLSWANDTLSWAKETWGADNVVSASLHVDEKTPHIHMILVPIVTGQSRRTASRKRKEAAEGKESRTNRINNSKERLSANDVYTLGKLYAYHDSYYEQVSSKYGINRGVRAEPGCHKKHDDSIEYNRNLERQAEKQKALIAEFQADYEETAEMAAAAKANVLEQQDAIGRNAKTLSSQQAGIEEGSKKLDELKAEQTKATGMLRKQEKLISENEATIKNQEQRSAAAEARLSEQHEAIVENDKALREQRKEYGNWELEVIKLGNRIDDRKADIRSLYSHGLMELIKEIPELVRKDVQRIVSRYWKGEVSSVQEIKRDIGGKDEDLVQFHLKQERHEYLIEVSIETGLVWINNRAEPTKLKDGQTMYMTELAQYFKEELNDEAREFVRSLYRKPEAEATVRRKPSGMRM